MPSLPRPNFRVGLIASALATLVGVFAIPAAYSKFGEGPELARAAVLASPEVARECGVPSNFVLVPWRLSIEDSDSQGHLELQYWFRCRARFGSAFGKYNHTGGGWVVEALTVRVGDHEYNLVVQSSQAKQ